MIEAKLSNERSAFILIRELGKALRIFQDGAVFCEDLTFTQFIILDHVMQQGRLPMSDLHALLAVEKSTTTRLVQPLVNRQVVIKEKSKSDSRVVELVITDEGRKLHKQVWECIAGFVQHLQETIPQDQREPVAESLGLFSRSLLSCCGKQGCC